MDSKQHFTLSEYPDKKPEFVSGWNMHRCKSNNTSKRVTLFEMYRYFPKVLLLPLMKFLQTKQFIYTKDTKKFPSIFNPILAMEGKVHNGQGKEPKRGQHKFTTHYARVITHRHQPYLVRIYECLTNDYNQIKLEILHTELYAPSKSPKRIYGLANPLHKLRAMNEIRNRVDKRFKSDPECKYPDHSGGTFMKNFVDSFFDKAAKDTPDVCQRMLKHKKEFSDLY